MDATLEPMVDLSSARALAEETAHAWGLTLGTMFALSNVSFVAPVGEDLVIKVASLEDDESLHEADALERWDGNGAVRLRRRSGRVLLMERARPGEDLSGLDEAAATAIAVEIAQRLWRPATPPFRPVQLEVRRWLDEAEPHRKELVTLARGLLEEIGGDATWLVHGDFHHHNVVRHGDRYVAIDPKPYAAAREYDVASFLWNPLGTDLGDRARTERRIAAFVEAGLDEFRIRAWALIRGSYLRMDPSDEGPLRDLLERSSTA